MRAKDKAKPVSRARSPGGRPPARRAVRLDPGRRRAVRRGHPRQPGARHHAGRPGHRAEGRRAAGGRGPRPGAGGVPHRKDPLRPGARDVHTHVERRLGELVGKDAGYLHAGAAATTRWPSTSGSSWSAPARARTARSCGSCGRSWRAPAITRTPSSPATPTCSAPAGVARAPPARARGGARPRPATPRRGAPPRGGVAARLGRPRGLDAAARPRGTARALGLDGVTQNSLDAVSDRDSAVELLFACALAAVHLSRIGEEIVLWTTKEFDFMTLDDAFATGSSLMPQKKNPTWASSRAGAPGAPSATSSRSSPS